MVEGEDQEDEEGMSLLVNRFCTKNKQWGFGLVWLMDTKKRL
jgi:hypothetical protein